MTLFTETRQDSTQNHFFANAISQKIAYRKPYKHLINTMIFHAFLLRFRDCAQNVTHAKRLNLYQNMVQMQSARSQNPARCQGLKKTRQNSTQNHFFGDCDFTRNCNRRNVTLSRVLSGFLEALAPCRVLTPRTLHLDHVLIEVERCCVSGILGRKNIHETL